MLGGSCACELVYAMMITRVCPCAMLGARNGQVNEPNVSFTELCVQLAGQRTTSTSRMLSRARKNLIEAKSWKRFSICRLLNTRCSRGDLFSECPGSANLTCC